MLARITVVFLVLCFFVSCQQQKNPSVRVYDAWVREPPDGHPISAAYMQIENLSQSTIEVIRVSSPDVGRVEMHRMDYEGGMMRMRKVGRLVLGAGDRLSLHPHGVHLMLFDFKRKLNEGSKIRIKLHMLDDTEYVVEAIVRRETYAN